MYCELKSEPKSVCCYYEGRLQQGINVIILIMLNVTLETVRRINWSEDRLENREKSNYVMEIKEK